MGFTHRTWLLAVLGSTALLGTAAAGVGLAASPAFQSADLTCPAATRVGAIPMADPAYVNDKSPEATVDEWLATAGFGDFGVPTSQIEQRSAGFGDTAGTIGLYDPAGSLVRVVQMSNADPGGWTVASWVACG